MYRQSSEVSNIIFDTEKHIVIAASAGMIDDIFTVSVFTALMKLI